MAAKAETPEDLKAHFETLSADVQALAASVAQLTKAEGEKLKAKGQEQYEALASEAAVRGRQASAAVQENPGAAIVIASGVGFLAGLLLGRK